MKYRADEEKKNKTFSGLGKLITGFSSSSNTNSTSKLIDDSSKALGRNIPIARDLPTGASDPSKAVPDGPVFPDSPYGNY